MRDRAEKLAVCGQHAGGDGGEGIGGWLGNWSDSRDGTDCVNAAITYLTPVWITPIPVPI